MTIQCIINVIMNYIEDKSIDCHNSKKQQWFSQINRIA